MDEQLGDLSPLLLAGVVQRRVAVPSDMRWKREKHMKKEERDIKKKRENEEKRGMEGKKKGEIREREG